MTEDQLGDQAFRRTNVRETWVEMTYGGALSFMRRQFSRNLEDIDVVISGIPFDNAVTYRPGCRFGPAAIRTASAQLAELKSFPFGFNPFETLAAIDYGDCFIDPHHPDGVIDSILNHARHILRHNTTMLTFGGDHFTSYPLLKAHAERHGPLALLQFDAHCDTWEDDGARMDHGTMFARAIAEGIIDIEHSIQVGLRTHNDAETELEILTSPWIHRNGIDTTIDTILNRCAERPCYISFDIDVLDPAFAPGTGTPVSGGLASWQALEILRAISSLNLIGMDLVEVSPPYDHADITATAAATIAQNFLCLLALKKGAKPNPRGKV